MLFNTIATRSSEIPLSTDNLDDILKRNRQNRSKEREMSENAELNEKADDFFSDDGHKPDEKDNAERLRQSKIENKAHDGNIMVENAENAPKVSLFGEKQKVRKVG